MPLAAVLQNLILLEEAEEAPPAGGVLVRPRRQGPVRRGRRVVIRLRVWAWAEGGTGRHTLVVPLRVAAWTESEEEEAVTLLLAAWLVDE